MSSTRASLQSSSDRRRRAHGGRGHETALRRRVTAWVLASLATALLLPAAAGAATATPGSKAPSVPTTPRTLAPAEVVAIGADDDGLEVVVRGEAIGDRLNGRDGGYWLNVGQDGTAIGLWGPRELSDTVEDLGDYHASGDIVEARGTYNAACDTHGGDRDVHITELRVIERGAPIERPVGWWQVPVGFAFFAVAGLLWQRHRTKMQRTF